MYPGAKQTRKVILTCAVTGENPVNKAHPNFPITPTQIAEASREAALAGASIVHVHARDPQTGSGSSDPRIFQEIVNRIRDLDVDIVINVTCGGGAFFFPDPDNEAMAQSESVVLSAQERVEHIGATLPEICSLDICTANQVFGDKDFVYLNTPRTLRRMAEVLQAMGVKPELEVFNPGDIMFGRALVEEGLISLPPLFQFVLGTKWCAPSTPEMIQLMRSLLPKDAVWTAMGIGSQQMPTAAQSILLGGNVRVGLEDNLYLKKGVFASNGQLVERAVTIIEALGECVATAGETRMLLGLTGPS